MLDTLVEATALQVIEDLLPVVRAHRDLVVAASLLAAAALFRQELGDHRHHVGITLKVLVFEEGARA